MIQILGIFGDVLRIATFQWRDERHNAKRCEELASPFPGNDPVRWLPFRRSRP
ncbi:hypothetical protein [Mesorhizobium sp. M0488]|uniref:hypothetical protein n=1 Tax=unclassified Mesorhizobium TaxID=325217 RepID=UPI00333C9797